MAITVSRLYSDNNGPAQNWIESLFGLTAGQTLLSVDMTWFVRPSPQSGAESSAGWADDVFAMLIWTTGTPPPFPDFPKDAIANLNDIVWSGRFPSVPRTFFTNGTGQHMPDQGGRIHWEAGRRDALLPGNIWFSAEISRPPGFTQLPYFLWYEAAVTWDDNGV